MATTRAVHSPAANHTYSVCCLAHTARTAGAAAPAKQHSGAAAAARVCAPRSSRCRRAPRARPRPARTAAGPPGGGTGTHARCGRTRPGCSPEGSGSPGAARTRPGLAPPGCQASQPAPCNHPRCCQATGMRSRVAAKSPCTGNNTTGRALWSVWIMLNGQSGLRLLACMGTASGRTCAAAQGTVVSRYR